MSVCGRVALMQDGIDKKKTADVLKDLWMPKFVIENSPSYSVDGMPNASGGKMKLANDNEAVAWYALLVRVSCERAKDLGRFHDFLIFKNF